MTDHELKSISQIEYEAAKVAVSGIRVMDLDEAARHVVLTLRPSMWLALQRKVDVLEAQLARSLHPSSQ